MQPNHYYVDKTPFLFDIFQKNDEKHMLLLGPRRFGKTFTLKLMEAFFSKNSSEKPEIKDWFKNFVEIGKNSKYHEFFKQNFG